MPPAIQKHFHLGRPPLRMLSESWFYFRQMGLLEQLLMKQGILFDTKWMEEVCCLLVFWFTSTDQWPGRACCCYLPGPTLSCGKVPTSKHRKPVQWTTAWNRWVRKCTKLYHIHVLKSGLNCYLSLHCWFPRTKVEQPDKTWGIPHPCAASGSKQSARQIAQRVLHRTRVTWTTHLVRHNIKTPSKAIIQQTSYRPLKATVMPLKLRLAICLELA